MIESGGNMIKFIISLLIFSIIIFLECCFKISSWCNRIEEKMKQEVNF